MQERPVEQAPSALGAFTRHPATIAILALGITQIVAWGTTLYALGVLGKPIAADTGWSQTIVFGGLTIGLLVSGATSTFVGRLIDRRGGQVRHGARDRSWSRSDWCFSRSCRASRCTSLPGPFSASPCA